MHELIGKAREEDDQFWSQLGFFKEAESDDDYVASSAGEDVVDSDFDQPEEEEHENESESTKERDMKKKAIPIPKPPPHKTHIQSKPSNIIPETVAVSTEQSVAGQSEAPPTKKTKRLTAEVPLPIEQVNMKS